MFSDVIKEMKFQSSLAQSLGSSTSVTLPPYWNNNSLLGVASCIVFHRRVIDPNILVWIHFSIDYGQPDPKSEACYIEVHKVFQVRHTLMVGKKMIMMQLVTSLFSDWLQV